MRPLKCFGYLICGHCTRRKPAFTNYAANRSRGSAAKPNPLSGWCSLSRIDPPAAGEALDAAENLWTGTGKFAQLWHRNAVVQRRRSAGTILVCPMHEQGILPGAVL